MPHNRNNQNLTRLKVALSLSDHDVQEILIHQGEQASKSKIKAWTRGQHSGRVVAMADCDFDKFCAGLVAWCRSQAEGNRVLIK